MKKTALHFMVIISFLMLITSCKKNDSAGDYDYSVAQDQSFAENTFEEVSKMADQAGDYSSLITYRTGSSQGVFQVGCGSVSIANVTATVKKITIDFGATEVTCMDGKRRKGKIFVDFEGNYRDINHVHTISFENYFVNDYKVEGTKTVTNTGKNALNQSVFSINVNATIKNPNGKTMTWTSQRTRTWTAGEGTTFATDGLSGLTDDQYQITGSGSGTSFNGTSFSITITDALLISGDCRFILSGKAELAITGKATRYLDYGAGVCDNIVIVTINGVNYYVQVN
jgi:hypothetical protein